ncbi:MAG: DNA-binding protein [Candidatus Omnitrophica bacterium]|nr:DNA-binding protein [Candidatus Omnitrophota bacterium]
MLRYKKVIYATTIWVFVFIYSVVYAQSISSKELINQAQCYDGKEIVYKGEIIGEMMCRKKGCWVNISDRDFGIGVWIPSKIRFNPKYTGSYKSKGDVVEVKGIFNYSCKEHFGELDIHAQQIKLIKEGYPIIHRLNTHKVTLNIFIWSAVWMTLKLMRLKKR